MDWQNGTVSFTCKKTGVPVLIHLGAEASNLFKDLPSEGVLSRMCLACAREKLIKIRAKVVPHSQKIKFQMADAAIP